MNSRLFIFVLLGLCSLPSFGGQISESVKLVWDEEWTNLTEKEKTLMFESCAIEKERDYLPYFSKTFELDQEPQNIVVSLDDAQASPMEDAPLSWQSSLTNQFQTATYLGKAKGKWILRLEILPLKNSITGISKLDAADLNISYQSKSSPRSTQLFKRSMTNSVLQASNGDFYKIRTQKSGIHRLDYNLLVSQMGLDPASHPISTIRVFGNGGGMLPERSGDFRVNDLGQIPVEIHDQNSNDLLDAGDYLLCYLEGPDEWQYDTADNFFTFYTNLFADYAYYFVQAKAAEVSERIVDQSSSGLTATHTVNSFDRLAAHESEEVNLIKSGRQWFGDYFNEFDLSHTFSFNFPNVIGSEVVRVKSRAAARNIFSFSTMELRANGTLINTLSFAKAGNGYDQVYATVDETFGSYSTAGSSINLALSYSGGSDAQAWLDYLMLNARCDLSMSGNEMFFRDSRSADIGNVSDFEILGTGFRVWEVSDIHNVKNQLLSNISGGKTFRLSTDTLRTFIAFNNAVVRVPELGGKVEPQNLHGISGIPDMIIVTNASLMAQAQRLADHRMVNDDLDVLVADVQEIYNEFASGASDITAVRDFVKMFYDRATIPSDAPKYLLLFGDCSYDYKNIQIEASQNHNIVPIYESNSSTHPAASYSTDDYFGFLDDAEGKFITGSSPVHLLDIAVGRIPVQLLSEAKAVVDKIINYESQRSLGPWRNVLSYIGDDQDGNVHMRDIDNIAEMVRTSHPVYNAEKIYLDAYAQNSGIGEDRYPDVNRAIANRILNGTLMLNYMGHGGPGGWAHERILSSQDILNFENKNKLPLVVTATCSFSKMDDPDQRSGGEWFLLHKEGGAIGLVSTTRIVYTGDNRVLNENFTTRLFTPTAGVFPTIGEATLAGKNATSSNANNRKFALLGDPALRLNYPEWNVVTKTINGNGSLAGSDTLKALQPVTISGELQDDVGNLMSGFNGTLTVVVFDKEQTLRTLANDDDSYERNFQLQKNALYRGKASVEDGEFSFSFIVPKDISYSFGQGKLSYYAENGNSDANGHFVDFIIGGTDSSAVDDNEGPLVEVFMNDESFAFGGITNESPLLLVKLEDEHGINTVGNGIGHDITAVINSETENEIVLNEFYEAEVDDFTKGEVQYKLTDLPNGTHTLKVKAWDVYNNSGEGYTEFVVSESAELALDHVLNYPNPFTTNTNFIFEHNRPGENLTVTVQIYSVGGQLVKTIERDIQTNDFQVNLDDGLSWDGLDDFGSPIGKGVYVYRLSLTTEDGSQAQKLEKLVILR